MPTYAVQLGIPLQVQGGGLRDSFLVDGVAFKKTFSYAGFEMQPKAYDNPRILLLNIELELKSEKENAEVGVSTRLGQLETNSVLKRQASGWGLD